MGDIILNLLGYILGGSAVIIMIGGLWCLSICGFCQFLKFMKKEGFIKPQKKYKNTKKNKNEE